MKIKHILCILFPLLVSSLFTAGPAKDTGGKISAFIKPYVESRNFSGGILVVKEGKTLFEGYYGQANFELQVPVTRATKFDIASISKSFTAAAVLLLQQQGLLKIGDPLQKYLPGFPNGDRITLHHLLVHSSGISRLIFNPDYPKLEKQHLTLAEVVTLFKDKPLDFPPGTRSGYSNANYILLAYLVEQISGLSFAEFLQTHFFIPLGMTDTILHTGTHTLIMNRAEGYEVTGFHDLENTEYANPSIAVGASAVYTTPADLYTWLKGLLAGRVLKKETLEQMFSDQEGGRGYGCILTKQSGRRVYSMAGWNNHGFTSGLTHYPDVDLTIIILSNIEIITLKQEIGANIADIVFSGTYRPFHYHIKPVDPAFAQKAAGVYQFGKDFYSPGAKMRILFKDGNLVEHQQSTGRCVGMIPVSGPEFIHRSSWGRVIFNQEENGSITGLKIYGHFTAQKIE